MLLHVCCADCLLKIYQTFDAKQRQELQLFFYNPNIYPREEYMSRLKAIKKVVKEMKPVPKIIVPAYQPQTYFSLLPTNPSENNTLQIISQSQRCPLCWQQRLTALFDYAKERGIKTVSSTLISSSYQDVKTIVKIAEKLAKEYQLDFYLPDLTEIDYQQSTCGFYKQNYCGCLYSLVEKSREKYNL